MTLTYEEKFKRFKDSFPSQDEQFREFLARHYEFTVIEKGLIKEKTA